jgi:hypothetical protein
VKFIPLIMLVGGLLSGCARPSPLFSDDGAKLVLGSHDFHYQEPGKPETVCTYGSKRRPVAACRDGTTSRLTVSGLFFKGVILAEFKGKRFSPASEPTLRSNAGRISE